MRHRRDCQRPQHPEKNFFWRPDQISFDAPVGSGHNRSSLSDATEMRCPMLYAILCYHDEDLRSAPGARNRTTPSWKNCSSVQEKLAKQGRLGPVARLLPTTAATTLRKDEPPLVLDGPFAETKEQLLGFYLVDCKNLDEALDVARDLGKANPGGGAYEIRPVGLLQPRWRASRDRYRLDRCRADLGAAPGGRRAAALLPQSRYRRGSVPERLPARAEELAAERPAARSRGVADHGRPQRRDRRGRGARKQRAAARGRRRSPTSTTPRTRSPSGSTARTTATTSCGCCSSAAIPTCRRRSRSRWRCASSPA